MAILKVIILGGESHYTFRPGHRLIMTHEHYFLVSTKTLKASIYLFISSISMACFLCLYFFADFDFGTALIISVFSLFIFSFLSFLLIRREDSNCWRRNALRFVDREKRIIGIFVPSIAKIIGYMSTAFGPWVTLPGVLRFKINKKDFEIFEEIIKDDLIQFSVGEKDVASFSTFSLAIISILAFIIFVIVFFVAINNNY